MCVRVCVCVCECVCVCVCVRALFVWVSVRGAAWCSIKVIKWPRIVLHNKQCLVLGLRPKHLFARREGRGCESIET